MDWGSNGDMNEMEKAARKVQGQVKWFDPAKGFGFIVSDEGGADILLHANVLRNFVQSSVADGARIDVWVQETARGIQALEVLNLQPPEGITGHPSDDMAGMTQQDLEAQPLEPARIKWFDKAKGFGFGNVFGSPEDVFVHIEVLRRSGLADLQPGEAVALRIVNGKRGRMATQVCSWETAARGKT